MNEATMKLYTAHRAPYPRRVLMFIHEKAIEGIERIPVDLMANEHRSADFRNINPFSRIPVLKLDDGSAVSEARAICSYLEAIHPEPNLMGRTGREHAFIEMQDRRMDAYWMGPIIAWIRNSLPGMDALVGTQYKDYAESQRALAFETAAWLDRLLANQEWIAGDRFTIADITAFCALEVARVVQFRPGSAGFGALQGWRDRVAARESARAD